MTYDFAGRALVLTGAAGGIGREIAKRFTGTAPILFWPIGTILR